MIHKLKDCGKQKGILHDRKKLLFSLSIYYLSYEDYRHRVQQKQKPTMYRYAWWSFLPMNIDTHCLLSICTLGPNMLTIINVVFYNLNKDFKKLTSYTRCKLFLIMLKRVKIFGLPNIYCEYLSSYIKLHDMLIWGKF